MTETMKVANLIKGKEISAAEMDRLGVLAETTGYPIAFIIEIYTDAVLQHLSGMKYENNVDFTNDAVSNMAQSKAIVDFAIQNSQLYKK